MPETRMRAECVIWFYVSWLPEQTVRCNGTYCSLVDVLPPYEIPELFLGPNVEYIEEYSKGFVRQHCGQDAEMLVMSSDTHMSFILLACPSWLPCPRRPPSLPPE